MLIWRAISGYTDCQRTVARTIGNDIARAVPGPKGSLSISATVVFIALKTRIWYTQYKCTGNIVNRIWSRYALFLFEGVNHLFCILLIFYESKNFEWHTRYTLSLYTLLTVLYNDILLWILMILVCFKEGSLYILLLHFVFTDEIILMAYIGNFKKERLGWNVHPTFTDREMM